MDQEKKPETSPDQYRKTVIQTFPFVLSVLENNLIGLGEPTNREETMSQAVHILSMGLIATILDSAIEVESKASPITIVENGPLVGANGRPL